jgi:hypothetical protein
MEITIKVDSDCHSVQDSLFYSRIPNVDCKICCTVFCLFRMSVNRCIPSWGMKIIRWYLRIEFREWHCDYFRSYYAVSLVTFHSASVGMPSHSFNSAVCTRRCGKEIIYWIFFSVRFLCLKNATRINCDCCLLANYTRQIVRQIHMHSFCLHLMYLVIFQVKMLLQDLVYFPKKGELSIFILHQLGCRVIESILKC